MNISYKLHMSFNEPAQNKRIIDGYEEKQSIQIAGNLVIFAENAKADEPYMVCFAKWDNPFNASEYYNITTTADYVEALELYACGIKSFTQIIQNERAEYNSPAQILTAADCIPNGLNDDLTDKVVVIKPEVLAPEYCRSERQIKVALSGFGCSPNARGTAVFCKDLYSGKESRFERYDILGLADTNRLPDWAKQKLALMEALKEPGVFEFGEYHFKPYRKFERRDGDTVKKMNRMSSDREIGLSKYEWQKSDYSHEKFYAASGNRECDIFKCVENGKLYVPCDSELFQYNEPPQNVKAKENKPTLQDKLENAKKKAAAQDSERKNNPQSKNHDEMEM